MSGGNRPTEMPTRTADLPRARRRPNGEPDVVRMGIPRDGWRDIYSFLLIQPWPIFYLLIVAFYLLVNCGFATLYWLQPGCIAETPRGYWPNDFFFSFETIATVGYGVMHPATPYAHWLAVAEIMFGVLAVPLATGLTIQKFARPFARVEFSHNALITQYDGVRTLLFRVANYRSSQIVEARIILNILRSEVTQEGHAIRRLIELQTVRATNPMFVMTWSVMHRLDEQSPLYGLDPANPPDGNVEIMAVMTGLDPTTSANVHARHIYQMEDVLAGHRFADIVFPHDRGGYAIDYRRLHEVIPCDPHPATADTSAADPC